MPLRDPVLEQRRQGGIQMLLDMQAAGELEAHQRQQVAKAIKYTDRHVRDVLTNGGLSRAPRTRFSMPRGSVEREMLWLARGNVCLLHTWLQQTQSAAAPARRTIEDAKHTDVSPAELAQMKKGDRKRRAYELYIRNVYTDVGQVCELDIKILSVFCRHPKTGKTVQLAACNAIDCCSRVVGDPFVTADEPGQTGVMEGFRRMVLGEFGGIPRTVRTDNGSEYIGNELKDDLILAGVRDVQLCDPYHPQQKGTIEAYQRLVETRFCAPHPFYGHVPERQDEKPYLPDGPLPTAAQVEAEYREFVRQYNHTWIHSELGHTPAEEWRRHSR